MLLHTEQRRNLALTSRTAAASASASCSLERRIWNASLCALLAPTPGSFLSSSIRRDMGSANLDIRRIVRLRLTLFVRATTLELDCAYHRRRNRRRDHTRNQGGRENSS